jgi:PAS domain S-box-containing protein
MNRRPTTREVSQSVAAGELKALSANFVPALEELPIHAFLIDKDGRVRWMSNALESIYGDLRGRDPESMLAPADRAKARSERAQKLLGVKRTSMYHSHLVLPDGTTRPVEVNSVALDDGCSVVGIFGILEDVRVSESARHRVSDEITPRQHEVLRLLATGLSTKQIANELNISPETVRSHIRGLLTALGAHSRLEANAVANRQGLI